MRQEGWKRRGAVCVPNRTGGMGCSENSRNAASRKMKIERNEFSTYNTRVLEGARPSSSLSLRAHHDASARYLARHRVADTPLWSTLQARDIVRRREACGRPRKEVLKETQKIEIGRDAP